LGNAVGGTLENAISRIVRETALKVSDAAGDGSKTATVLARRLPARGIKCIAVGVAPIALKCGIDKALERAIEEVRGFPDPETVKQSRISHPSVLGTRPLEVFIAEAMDRVGCDGVITVEASRPSESSLKMLEGMKLEGG